jgi:lysozyme
MSIPNTVSPEGIALIKRFEGCHKLAENGNYRAYRCVAGKWTIGYGHTYGVRSGVTATVKECNTYLQEDITKIASQIRQVVTVPLSQAQFDALASFVFNIGIGNFKKSTILKNLNKGKHHSVPLEMMRWNKAKVDGVMTELGGLTRRRAAEGALWALENDLGEKDPVMPQRPDMASLKPLTQSKTILGSVVAIGGILTAELVEKLSNIISYSNIVSISLLALSICGAGLAIYSRIKDYKEGKN